VWPALLARWPAITERLNALDATTLRRQVPAFYAKQPGGARARARSNTNPA
jgi:hypothetical protein